MKMKAAVMEAVNQPLVIKEMELDEPKSNEVLVKILATAVCHSDLNGLEDDTAPLPMILGHEACGLVVKTGDSVKTCKVGDKVVHSWDPACGTCPYCRTGKTHLRESAFGPMCGGTLLDDTSRLHTTDGGDAYHYSLLSTFAEYTVVPAMSCVPVPDDMPAAQACMIGCGVATGYGAAVKAAKVEPGSSVAVFGLGGVGTNAIQGAKLAGASTIIACDIKDKNLEKAKEYGATHTVNTLKVNAPEAIAEICEGIGCDYAIDCTGNTMVGAMAYESIRKGGTAVVIGAYPGDGKLTLPAGGFHRTAKVLRGSFYGDVNPFDDFPKIAQMYMDGKYDLDSLIIEKIDLEDINKAFDAFHDPNGNNMGRYIITFEE
ncbi:MAG: Zn-dependent alcohol dehydrogenase [Eubacterium sp.]|nr:Zn-dependent alcohol dehydrogenase [Candidatus Colimonas fimequi]